VEEEFQVDTDHEYDFIDEHFVAAINTSSIYETTQETGYDYCISEHDAHSSINISNTFNHNFINLLFLPES
jgi:hypothetical protein